MTDDMEDWGSSAPGGLTPEQHAEIDRQMRGELLWTVGAVVLWISVVVVIAVLSQN